MSPTLISFFLNQTFTVVSPLSINKKAGKDYWHLIAILSIHGLNCYAPSVLIEQEKVQTYWAIVTKELS